MTPEDLETLGLALGKLSLKQSPTEPVIGGSLPKNCRMITRTTFDTTKSSQTVEFWEQHASNSAVSIPVTRKSGVCNTRSKTKAVAVLVRSSSDQLQVAVSGWDSNLPSSRCQLKASIYVDKVRTMCSTIGHTLIRHCYDRGEAGRYHACHAEKQLLAFLFEQEPRRKRVRIHQNLEPCDDCHRCLKAFVLATGIAVTVFVHGENDGTVSAASLPAPRKIRYLQGGLVVRSDYTAAFEDELNFR